MRRVVTVLLVALIMVMATATATLAGTAGPIFPGLKCADKTR